MKHFLILCVFISHNFAFAQKNLLLPGKIETKDGQRIEGKIVFKDNGPTPQEIEFYNTEMDKSQKYNPSELISFEIEGRRFVSRIISIDVTPQRLQKQDYLNGRKQVSDTIFLTLQVKSAVSLLYYQDKDHREHFFIQNEEGEIIELIKHEYFDKILNPNFNHYEEKLVTSSKYKNQLVTPLNLVPLLLNN